jgi:hypothetical protein
MDAELNYAGDPTLAAAANMQKVLATPYKSYFCPSRRRMTTATYTNSSFPANTDPTYSALKGKQFTTALIDYAGCNGNSTVAASLNAGAIRSQGAGKAIVQEWMITDGLAHTLLFAEKAVNPSGTAAVSLNVDDMGYTAGFSGSNFNTTRVTATNLLPVWDRQLTGNPGAAFGSSHAGTWNALMADLSVQQLSYTIDANVYAGLGTIAGKEIITDADLES